MQVKYLFSVNYLKTPGNISNEVVWCLDVVQCYVTGYKYTRMDLTACLPNVALPGQQKLSPQRHLCGDVHRQ